MKLHPRADGFDLRHPDVEAVFAVAAERRLPDDPHLREQLHNGIYETFAVVGAQLELPYRGEREQATDAEAALRGLADAVYDLNIEMIRHVREGRVGTVLPETGSRAARALSAPRLDDVSSQTDMGLTTDRPGVD